MKAVEEERTLYYWEILKEHTSGPTFGTVGAESYSTVGFRRSGTTAQIAVTPGGAFDFTWDYGTTRRIVEAVAARHGWRVKVVLRKGKARW